MQPQRVTMLLYLACAPITAQPSATIQTATALTATVGSETQTLAAGTNISSGTLVSVTETPPLLLPGCIALTASTRVTNQAVGNDVTVTLSSDISASPGFSTCTTSASCGGEILVTLSAPQPTGGNLEVHVGNQPAGFPGIIVSDGYADLHDDGDIEIRAGVPIPRVPGSNRLDLPVVLDPNGITVRLSTTSSVQLFTTQMNVTIKFTAGFGNLELAGSPCGPSLTAIHHRLLTGSRLDFVATAAAQTPFAFFVFGTTAFAVPVPPTGCELRTNILLLVATTLSPSGEATLSVPITPAVMGTFDSQFLTATQTPTGLLWHTSQRVRATL